MALELSSQPASTRTRLRIFCPNLPLLLIISGILSLGIAASLYPISKGIPIVPFSLQATFNSISATLLLPSGSTANDQRLRTSTYNYTDCSMEFMARNGSDQALFSRASMEPVEEMNPEKEKLLVPKVAFMFLTKGPLPLAPLWEKFFRGNQRFYSIYVHPHPFYNDSWPVDSVFYGRRIPSQPVFWGSSTMVDGERRLLAHALLETSNQRFVLLSEACIPVFDFRSVYTYLINTNLSMVQSFDDPRKIGRGRYNSSMSPLINVTNWRKGSQWFEIRRDLASQIVSDQKYFGMFKECCVPPRCYMDEHYIPTLANILHPESISNRSVTWVDWSKSGAHPVKFGKDDIKNEFLNKIRFRSKACVYNGIPTWKCFMFARKFAPDALEPLLRLAPLVFGIGP